MTSKEELLELIETGEGYTLELKENVGNNLGKEICAFANSDGGKIILGVRDDGSIKGLKLSNSDISKIQDIARNMDPSFNVFIKQIEDIVLINVPIGKNKPYSINGHFYVRQGANSQQLKTEEVREFFQNVNKISFEKKINADFDLKTDFNEGVFNNYISKIGVNTNLSKEHVLKNLNLLTDSKINNACVLLFANKVTKFFLSADISCVLYQGKSTMLDKKVFDEDFFSNFDNALKFVLRNIRTKAEIKESIRVESPEIPENALREAIINAMIHRDYFVEGRILINIFSDRIEVLNPGKLLFDENELGNISVTRNPIIADCMLRAGYVEKIGSGIKRIRELVPNVTFNISSNWFKVTFLRETTQETTQETTLRMLEVIRENPTITRKELAKIIGLSEDGIKYHLDKLRKEGVIRHVGATKKGYWEVLK